MSLFFLSIFIILSKGLTVAEPLDLQDMMPSLCSFATSWMLGGDLICHTMLTAFGFGKADKEKRGSTAELYVIDVLDGRVDVAHPELTLIEACAVNARLHIRSDCGIDYYGHYVKNINGKSYDCMQFKGGQGCEEIRLNAQNVSWKDEYTDFDAIKRVGVGELKQKGLLLYMAETMDLCVKPGTHEINPDLIRTDDACDRSMGVLKHVFDREPLTLPLMVSYSHDGGCVNVANPWDRIYYQGGGAMDRLYPFDNLKWSVNHKDVCDF